MVLAFGVQQLLSTDGTVTFGSGQMPGSLQPGPVLPVQRIPLPEAIRIYGGPIPPPSAALSVPAAE